MNDDISSQSPYRCKLDWGRIGAGRAAERGNIIVVVDVLSFSTAVAYGVSKGAIIYPCSEDVDAAGLARDVGAELAVGRKQVPEHGKYSLSPGTFDKIEIGTKVLLPSLNGGTCVQCSVAAAYVFAGALVNADAAADVVNSIMQVSDLDVTIIACGEREKQPPHELRPAVEDYLGAGAIIASLQFDKSPEAAVCEAAYRGNAERLGELIRGCVSGRELRAEGFEGDMTFASRLDALNVAPVLLNNRFVEYGK